MARPDPDVFPGRNPDSFSDHPPRFPELDRALPDSTEILYLEPDGSVYCGHHAPYRAAFEGVDQEGEALIPADDQDRRYFRDRHGYEMSCSWCEEANA